MREHNRAIKLNNYQLVALQGETSSVAYTVIDRRTGLQPALVCLWADHLARVVRPNSAKSYLRDIVIFLEWVEARDICLAERFARLEGLYQSELIALGDHLERRRDGTVAGASTINRRFAAIADFICFHMERYLERCHDSLAKSERAIRRIKKIQKSISRLRKNQAEVSLDEESARALSEVELKRIIDIAHPERPNNPFKSYALRIRNFCMLLVSIECLLRRSELALLEMDDLELSYTPTIRVKKPSDKNSKACKDGASIKTRGRLVPISRALAEWLSIYVDDMRQDLKRKGVASASLFLSERTGKRISTATANAYLQKISKAYENAHGEPIRLHAHMLRVTGATLLKKSAEESLSAERVFSKHMEIQDLMAYVGGWAPRSAMPKHYSRAALADKVRSIKNAKK